MKTQNVAIWGLTFPGEIYRELIQNGVPGLQVTTIVEADAKKRADLKQFPYQWFDDYQSLLSAYKPDAVIVSVPVPQRNEAAQACVDKGVPFLLHKPFSITGDETARVEESAAKKSVPHMYGVTGRFHPEFRAAYEAVKSGAIGNIVSMNERMHFGFSDRRLHTYIPASAGRGVGMGNGVHTFERFQFFAESPIVAIEGLVKSNKHLNEALEDYVAGTTVLKNGVRAQFSLRFTDDDEEDYVFQVAGAKGTITVEGFKRCVLQQGANRKVLFEHQLPHDGTTFRSRHLPGFKAKLEYFARFLNGKETENFARAGVDAMKAVDLIYGKSSK